MNAYGAQGYVLGAFNNGSTDTSSLPSGTTFTLDQGARYCWTCSTSDVRAMQDPANPSGARHASVLYHATQLQAHLNFADAYSGNLRIYAVDWDTTDRRQQVTLNDGSGSGNQTVDMTTAAFDQGAWLTFPITVAAGGRVDITIDRTAGYNAVLSGIFLGDAGPPLPPPPPPPTPPPSVAPQGSWVNAYGAQGYALGGWYGSTNSGSTGDLAALPAGATLTVAQGGRWCWFCTTTNVRALQSPDATERRGTTWFHNTQLRLNLRFNNGYAGTMRLYAVDLDNLGRRQTVTVNDGRGNQIVDLNVDFTQGAWMTFSVAANAGDTVAITADNLLTHENAVISGIFLGDGGPPPVPPPPPTGAAPGGAAAPTVQSDISNDPGFQSGIADAPDPFVLPVSTSFCSGLPAGSGCYYAYTTNVVFNPIPVWKSTNLTTWYQAGYFNDTVSVDPNNFARWSAEAFDKWAPGVIKIGSTYVMWYTAQNGHGPHCLGVATASSPNGPFRDVVNGPRVCYDSQGGVIDPSPFVDSNGARYLTFKTEGTGSQPSRIYVAPLSANGTSIGSRSLLLERQGGWEQPRIEGPTLWRSWSGLFLFYSAGNWEDASYVVGVARCNSPTGPCTRVYTTPVLANRGSTLGPGGQTPFVDAAGVARLSFHAWKSGSVGYGNGGERSLRFLTLDFPDGNPQIG